MAQDELSAVNALLNAIGSVSVSVLTTAPDVVAARNKLSAIARNVQEVGWYFNTEDYYYALDEDGRQPLPDNLLHLDTFNPTLIQRGTYIYDRVNHTNVLTGLALDGKKYRIVQQLDLTEVPYAAYKYIVSLAKVAFVVEFEGDYQKATILKADALADYTELQKKQLDTLETGYATKPQTARLMSLLPGNFRGYYT